MSIARYIATYVNRRRGGLRHRGVLTLLAVVSTVAVACVGTLPDVAIDPTDLSSLDSRDSGAPLSRRVGIPGQSAQLHDAPLATIKEGPATANVSPTEASAPAAATAGIEVEDEAERLDVDAGPSVFQRLNPDGPKLMDPKEYDQRLPLDAIRPIYEPLVGSPDEARLDADELVMGVSINGESRAYPIKVLRFREIVNDELGGSPILVTW